MAGLNGLAQVWSDWVQGNDAGTGARGKNRDCSRWEAPGLAVMPGGVRGDTRERSRWEAPGLAERPALRDWGYSR